MFAGCLIEAESPKLDMETFWNNHYHYHYLCRTDGILPSQERILALKLKIDIFRHSGPGAVSAVARLNSRVVGLISRNSLSFRCDYRTEINRISQELFVSEHGHVGLAPNRTKATDLICFVQGVMPLILRPLPEFGRYQLTGECYLHWLMHGELEKL